MNPSTSLRAGLFATVRARRSDAFSLDVALSAPAGVTILFGASGSGKSTVLRAIAGLLRPDAGSIAIGPRVLFDRSANVDVAARDRHIGYVFQHLALFPHLTVEENLAFGLYGQPPETRRRKVREIAASFRIDHLLERRPPAISGGERQRTALARSLVTDPAALLLDEPLSALDHVTQSRIIDDLRRWNAAHEIPILYVTHSHREVFALATTWWSSTTAASWLPARRTTCSRCPSRRRWRSSPASRTCCRRASSSERRTPAR